MNIFVTDPSAVKSAQVLPDKHIVKMPLETYIISIRHAVKIFPPQDSDPTEFVFAGPDEFKHDDSKDIFTKYKDYIFSKPWARDNYLRDPSRRPEWMW